MSNVTLLGKLIERESYRSNEHIMITSIVLTPGQYAYIRDHSSETLLIKIVNDIFIAADETTASGDALCWSTSSSLVFTVLHWVNQLLRLLL